MGRISIFLLAFCAYSSSLFSQNPSSATLATNRVKAVFNANGALFTDFQNGQFIAPYTPGQPERSLLRAAGLWITGKDAQGALHGAVQLYNSSGKSDFTNGTPDGLLEGVFRVTRAEIETFKADLADNGKIDNPQPGVMGWPGRYNPFFEEYNMGQVLPANGWSQAGFFDKDGDAVYDPKKGDYPAIEIRGCPLNRIPSKM